MQTFLHRAYFRSYFYLSINNICAFRVPLCDCQNQLYSPRHSTRGG